MLDAIQKLLVLQDRDRKILQLREELTRIPPERNELQARVTNLQSQLEASRLRMKQLESERKRLELDVEAKQQLINRYSLQQYQTKKNEEYRALTHEIDTCKADIRGLEDQQLDFMEQGEQAQQEATSLAQTLAETQRTVESRLADLAAAEASLRSQLAQLESERSQLAAEVEEQVCARYERLLKQKGGSVVVPIDRGVCGGCHMQISRHLVVACIADQEIVTCPNCGRLLYFTPGMDVTVLE
jgi:hypothetical protein